MRVNHIIKKDLLVPICTGLGNTQGPDFKKKNYQQAYTSSAPVTIHQIEIFC